ncbi:MAG: putative integral membrane protein (TIGR00698 family) [Chlamydiales bacterium]|jgi:uncharacterized integral membrane protein (TIGR00698 family)
MKKYLPGITLTFLIVLLASFIEKLPFWPFTIDSPSAHPIDRMILAILIGMTISHLSNLATKWKEGIGFSTQKLLPFAIILMGARLDFNMVLAISWKALWINIICVSFAFLLTVSLCNWAKINQKVGILVAIGTAICGGTAIVAAAPVIRADATETSVSVTTITLFGILAIFFFPILGHFLELNEIQFGIWAGTSIQALPQVVAAGFAFGENAGEISLLVKLVRILLLAPFILCLSLWYSKKQENEDGEKQTNSWQTYFPPFVIGFILMATLSTSGWIVDIPIGEEIYSTKKILSKISGFLIAMAMAGVGLGTNLKGAMKTQVKVLGAGFTAATILAAVSYVLIRLLIV